MYTNVQATYVEDEVFPACDENAKPALSWVILESSSLSLVSLDASLPTSRTLSPAPAMREKSSAQPDDPVVARLLGKTDDAN